MREGGGTLFSFWESSHPPRAAWFARGPHSGLGRRCPLGQFRHRLGYVFFTPGRRCCQVFVTRRRVRSLTGEPSACAQVTAFTTLRCRLNFSAAVLGIRPSGMSMPRTCPGVSEMCTTYL